MHCTKAMQASFGQVLTELPADELLVLTDDVFCSFTTTPTTVGYERGSTLVTSNLPFQMTEVLGAERLTGAPTRRWTEGPPQAEQAHTQPSTRPLNHHYISCGVWRLPLRPKRGAQIGPRASARFTFPQIFKRTTSTPVLTGMIARP